MQHALVRWATPLLKENIHAAIYINSTIDLEENA